MQNGSKTRGIALAIAGVVLCCLACCALYTISTKSFPIQVIDRSLFKDIAYEYDGGTDALGNGQGSQRLWFWEGARPPADVARDGYDLVAWNTGQTENEYTAQWKLSEYAISYDLGYGSAEPGQIESLPESCTMESPPIALPQLTRYAYAFGGWALEDGTIIEELDCAPIRSDTTVHAIWNRLDFIKRETIYLGDEMTAVPYIYSINSETAPVADAGVWQGIADVEDGLPTYYIGHNPGVFAPVESFEEGSLFAVCDDNNNLGVYRVERIVVILYEGTMWTEELEKLTMPAGEYASLQTCRGDKVFMDIYVAKRIDG